MRTQTTADTTASASRAGRSFRSALIALLSVLSVAFALALAQPAGAQSGVQGADVREPSPTAGNVPGNALGNSSDSQMWLDIRKGLQGTVSLPDKKLGILIQSEGENWRAVLNGPVKLYGSWLLLGMIALLALFFALRGRVPIDGGWSGRTVERFNSLDRFAHWLSAVSFIVLAVTGLNIVYGKYVLMPVIGPAAFAWFTQVGKYIHNYVAFAFMAGILMMFLLWVRFNIPKRHDLTWIRQGGGLFNSKIHPVSERFNAGQKAIFWLVALGGLSLSMSGIALLFPYEFGFFAKTFETLNLLGLNLPTELSPIAEQQLNVVWHSIVGFVMIAVILAHIYIGSVGMQGAFAAMGSGRVDENWAAEHHNLWYERLKREGYAPPSGRQPAE
jgi:formate dehydrogenase subunit gamma